MLNLVRQKKNNIPDFVIIGAQKSGTSSLFNYLNQSKYLQGSTVKETHYFDQWQFQNKNIGWYKSHFVREKGKVKKPLYFEATPNYIYHQQVPIDICKINPKTKFIVLLREPISRAFSAWNMYREMFDNKYWRERLKDGSIFKFLMEDRAVFPSFEETIEIELKLIKENTSIEPSIIRRGFYAEQLEKWFAVFPKESFLFLDFLDMKKNLNSLLSETFSFLDIPLLDYSKINLTPGNNRSYLSPIEKRSSDYLNAIYQPHNEKLEIILNRKFNW